MPEEISQAVSAELVTPQDTQVPESTPAGNTQPEPQTEQKPLTLEDVQRVAREEATRIAQSQVAKGENRIEKRIQEQLAALNASKGVLGLSDQQIEQAKQKIVTEAYTTPEPQAGTPTSEPGATPDVDQAIQYMNAEIENVFAEVGTSVTSADPEFKDLQAVIDAAWNDSKGLVKILRAADKAATAKAGRLQASRETAPARVVGGGPTSSGQVPASNAHDAWEQAYKK